MTLNRTLRFLPFAGACVLAAMTAQASVVMSAPEIDPASAASGLTLLMGGLLVLRGRRHRNSSARSH